MGQIQVKGKWINKNAEKYLSFLLSLLGTPHIYVDKSHGMAIWLRPQLSKKTLFSKPICFERIVLKDETRAHNELNPPHFDFLYATLQIPVTIEQQQALVPLSSGIGYDRGKQLLWVRCNSIDCIIATSKIVTDILLGKTSVVAVISNGVLGSLISSLKVDNPSTYNINIDLVKKLYSELSKNIEALNRESFMDDPWYAQVDPYASNQPLDIALVEQDDREFYNTIDNIRSYMDKRNASKKPNAYPRAPTGKPTVENFFGLGEIQKKISLGSGEERLIPFNAYRSYNKLDMGKPQPEKMTNSWSWGGFLKKKNT